MGQTTASQKGTVNKDAQGLRSCSEAEDLEGQWDEDTFGDVCLYLVMFVTVGVPVPFGPQRYK